MENNNNIMTVAMTTGAKLALALIVLSVLLYAVGVLYVDGMSFIFFGLIIIGAIYGTKSYRENQCDGIISYGRALGYATLFITLSAIIVATYDFVFANFIETTHIEKILEKQEIAMQKTGLDDEQIIMQIEATKLYYNQKTFAIFSFFKIAFTGFIVALITSIFLKKEGSGFDAAMKNINENEDD